MNSSLLLAALRDAAGPVVVGASIGDISDKATWRIDYDVSATAEQRAAALAALNAFDASIDPLAVREEAERRMATGIKVNGKPFRCDDTSVSRVRRMVDGFAGGIVGPDGVTFKTAAGDEFTLTSIAQASAIYYTQIGWQAAVLERSAALQDAAAPDPTLDELWPEPLEVTLPE